MHVVDTPLKLAVRAKVVDTDEEGFAGPGACPSAHDSSVRLAHRSSTGMTVARVFAPAQACRSDSRTAAAVRYTAWTGQIQLPFTSATAGESAGLSSPGRVAAKRGTGRRKAVHLLSLLAIPDVSSLPPVRTSQLTFDRRDRLLSLQILGPHTPEGRSCYHELHDDQKPKSAHSPVPPSAG